MSIDKKHIFVATHPRSCSTAFERVFMTCHDTLSCVHEPFGEAWYFGPERLNPRADNEEDKGRKTLMNGHDQFTYSDVFKAMDEQAEKTGKRLFIKDMAQYLMSIGGSDLSDYAPSLVDYRRGVGTTNGTTNGTNGVTNGFHDKVDNPTIVPDELFAKYHFTFLIRHPRSSIPSYFRCTIPPLSDLTGFHTFDPAEAGYKELRLLFDYLRESGQIGPKLAGKSSDSGTMTNGHGTGGTEICIVDADDMLNNPTAVIEAFCKSTGVEYSPSMLQWDDPETQKTAQEAFERWKGFHEDALDSNGLKARTHKKEIKTDEQLMNEWTEKYGKKAAEMIMQTVNDNVEHYEYLKQFALKI